MVYRFKVWFEDMEDIVRWIDIKPSHTFLDFHNILQESIGFDKKELASFYLSDEKWRKLMEITLEDMGEAEKDADPKLLMKNAKLRDFINDPHQRFVYVSDFLVMWTLYCELLSINDEAPKKEYPLVFRSEGKAPRQREDNRFKMVEDNEFDALAAKILAAKGGKNIMEGAEEELVEDAGEEDEEEDEFGFKSLGESNDDEFGLEGFSEMTETP
ncbi:MAG: hypothetical protein JNL57_03060 [Bacteroidetes bacterium]|nr:hypothetical protein [Bacteroidota bacterium]